jgi:hypothetical protein
VTGNILSSVIDVCTGSAWKHATILGTLSPVLLPKLGGGVALGMPGGGVALGMPGVGLAATPNNEIISQ